MRLLHFLLPLSLMAEPIERIWLTHRSDAPTHVVVNWETAEATSSVVEFGDKETLGESSVGEPGRLHHVEIPLRDGSSRHWYRIRSDKETSGLFSFKAYPADEIRVAVVADTGYAKNSWGEAVLRTDPHLLVSAGDHVPALHRGRPTSADDTTAFSALVARYPELFRSTPWLPLLGNHDREIRPRGPRPPSEPVYDVDANAFLSFFGLPADRWRWRFDLPSVGARLLALDLSHTSDQGTTWQTCHPFLPGSPQFAWFDKQMKTCDLHFLVPFYNEKNSAVRGFAGGEYGRLLADSSFVVTGFGYYAERAEADGTSYYNTSASGTGTPYKDPSSVFLRSEDNFMLLTFSKGKAVAQLRRIPDGKVMDEKTFAPRKARR